VTQVANVQCGIRHAQKKLSRSSKISGKVSGATALHLNMLKDNGAFTFKKHQATRRLAMKCWSFFKRDDVSLDTP
jgi:hypothetical protein